MKLKVRIKNISNRKVGAVRALDHSDTGWRYPIIMDEVRGPNGKIMTRAGLGGCGNSDSLLPKHVTVLGPGEEFDPFAEDPYGNNHVSGWIPYVEGPYTVALTIDYSAKDPAEWNGSIERRYADQEKVRQILALVPRVQLEAKVESEVSK